MNEKNNLVQSMLKNKVWGVVGATDNKEKFGYKVYKKLKTKGYTVYPINPKLNTVDGDKCYPDISLLPEKPQVINMVVSPKVGIEIINQALKLGIDSFWLQPGTYDEELMDLIEKNRLNAVQACVIVALTD